MHSGMQKLMTTNERGVPVNRAPTGKLVPWDPQTKPPAGNVTACIQTGASRNRQTAVLKNNTNAKKVMYMHNPTLEVVRV